jgi:hypothetical protein
MESSILNWRKSSHSGGNGGSCVEVGQAGRVLVRDTKQNATGPVLRFSPAAWRRFAEHVKRSLAPDPTGLPTPVGATLVSDGRGWPFAMPRYLVGSRAEGDA